jgi:hypothetical protein
MKMNQANGNCAARWIRSVLFASLLVCSVSLNAADTKPAAAKAPAVKAPAAKAPAAAPGRAGAPAAAGRGPTTAGAGAGRGPTTAGAGAGRGPTTAGRGPAAAGGRGPEAGARGPAVAGRRDTPGTRAVGMRGGGEAHLDGRGRVTDLHRGGMDVHRSPDGRRDIRVERADGGRVVVGRGGRGYVQGRYNYGGREFGHRTYYEHGRAYDRFYARYPYHGVYLEGYAPARYYPGAYYGWAYAPWAAPAPYAWGWVGNPWAVYYGGFFTPYPVYASPAFWLTDYLISASLAADYQARLDAANNAPPQAFAAPPTPLTPDVKQAISAEVQRQIALANAEATQTAANMPIDPASSGVVRMLTDNSPHVFVAGTDLDVIDARGAQCTLSQGDVIQLNPAPLPADAVTANLVVLASKPAECVKGNQVAVPLTDLQDMQNHMRETIDTGLGEMQTAKGLPPIPQSARAMPVAAPFAAAAPPPDPTAAMQITQQVQEADKAEQEATAPVTTAAPAPVAAPPTLPKEPKVGMTIAEIEASLGPPALKFSGAGNKTTYSYKDLGIKIVFTDGKVTAIN